MNAGRRWCLAPTLGQVTERVLVAAVPAVLIAAVAWSDGGYFPQTWGAVLLLGAIALAACAILCRTVERDARAVVVVAGLAGLAGWQLVSRAWAVAPDGAVLEAERTLLYATIAAAAFLAVGRDRADALVLGVALGAGATTVGGLMQHLADDAPGDRLEAPVGYANAAGILATTTLLLGLELAAGGPGRRRALGACLVVPAAVVVLLSLSRGALVAAVLGGVVLAATAASRRGLGRFAVAAVPVGVAVGAVAGALLLTGGDGAVAEGPSSDRRVLSSSSLRSDYWAVALEMVAAEPLHGDGAGGFERVWLRERDAVVFVRDAHNLYLETLAELGPLGLALLLVTLGAPLLAARKATGDPAGRAALAAYVALLAHAALDWDWELPAVTLCTVFLAVALVRLGGSGERRPLGGAREGGHARRSARRRRCRVRGARRKRLAGGGRRGARPGRSRRRPSGIRSGASLRPVVGGAVAAARPGGPRRRAARARPPTAPAGR